MTRHRPPVSRFVIPATVAVLATATFVAPPGLARGVPHRTTAAATTVATGLDSPRLLSFGPGGSLLVAEAGTGGTGPCVTGGEGGQVCLGKTGAITLLWRGHQARVVTGLPSLAGAEGDSALGPANVRFDRGRLVISLGAGIDAAARSQLGRGGRLLGTLIALGKGKGHDRHASSRTLRFRHHSSVRVLADIAAFELANNPDGSEARDSDPTGFIDTRHGQVLTDSGGNDLLAVRHGDVRVLAVFPDRIVPFPPEAGGGTGPMQAVPTSVERGPDGVLYVSQLTGFPFPVGAANIWRVVPGQAPTVYASGLTNVTDLAWHHGQLYAVQIADGGLAAATGLPTGSLLRVHAGDNSTPDVVSGGLPAPYGVAIGHGSAYVTTCSVCPGQGAVMRIPLG